MCLIKLILKKKKKYFTAQQDNFILWPFKNRSPEKKGSLCLGAVWVIGQKRFYSKGEVKFHQVAWVAIYSRLNE